MPTATPTTRDGEITPISAGKIMVALKIKSHRGLTEIQITRVNPKTNLPSKSLSFRVPPVVRNLKINDTHQRHDFELRNQKASIQTIENQVGQIAQLLSARPQGSLPSNIERNPNAEAKAITLRSGRSTIPVDASVSTPKPIVDEIETETPGEVHPRTYGLPIPYPGCLKKQKMEEEYRKFLELFKQLHINLPFLDTLKEMPKYDKFLKEVLSNMKKLEELSCVSNTLADLGASINLRPYSLFAKLDLGIVENMLVKVFPVDFVILDMDEDKNVLLILGRPFLATARALIDVCTGRLTL
ncbi:uncharacterized protein LOC143547659 [Bidens hawaiensis]|uniref:uncharacterized protein LOC143547659 n=1 Tax=Bidens hawaiensis TaxID=980011 RepID=UPI00404AC5DD